MEEGWIVDLDYWVINYIGLFGIKGFLGCGIFIEFRINCDGW